MSLRGYSYVVLAIFSIVLTQIYGFRKLNAYVYDLQPRTTLAYHNKIRAEVGVAPLVWDKRLAAVAKNYAKVRSRDCAPIHSTDERYGENIAIGWEQVGNQMSGPFATKLWYGEKGFYNYETNKCSDVCGHYTQIVANQSKRVGCATTRCRSVPLNKIWVVCNYAPRPMGDENTRPY